MKKILLLLLMMAVVKYATAQCSEAENATMKKYAELTRKGDAQGCSQCAWLANLFCIAENGLFKGDKAEVQVAINNTKENIKQMGEPICCPELLTKNPTFGQPKNAGTESGNGAGTPQTKAQQNYDAFMSEIEAAKVTMNNINTINKTFAELEKEIVKIEKQMADYSVMPDRIYQSEDDVNREYARRLENLKKLAEVHLALKTETQNLGYTASEELISNSSSRDYGVLVGIGALLNTDKKDSKAFSANAIENLKNSKYQKLFKVRYKDTDFSDDIISKKMNDIFSKTYSNDKNNFLNANIINGYKVGMKYNEFKKLIPNFKWKYISPGYYRLKDYGNGSDYFFQLGMVKKDHQTVRAIKKKTTYTAPFSPEKLLEYQQIIINEIKYFDSLFNVKPTSFSNKNGTSEETNVFEELNKISPDNLYAMIKNANPKYTDAEIKNAIRLLEAQKNKKPTFALPVNSLTSVFYTDKTNKNFTYNAKIDVKNEIISLVIELTEKNLLPIQ